MGQGPPPVQVTRLGSCAASTYVWVQILPPDVHVECGCCSTICSGSAELKAWLLFELFQPIELQPSSSCGTQRTFQGHCLRHLLPLRIFSWIPSASCGPVLVGLTCNLRISSKGTPLVWKSSKGTRGTRDRLVDLILKRWCHENAPSSWSPASHSSGGFLFRGWKEKAHDCISLVR